MHSIDIFRNVTSNDCYAVLTVIDNGSGVQDRITYDVHVKYYDKYKHHATNITSIDEALSLYHELVSIMQQCMVEDTQ